MMAYSGHLHHEDEPEQRVFSAVARRFAVMHEETGHVRSVLSRTLNVSCTGNNQGGKITTKASFGSGC